MLHEHRPLASFEGPISMAQSVSERETFAIRRVKDDRRMQIHFFDIAPPFRSRQRLISSLWDCWTSTPCLMVVTRRLVPSSWPKCVGLLHHHLRRYLWRARNKSWFDGYKVGEQLGKSVDVRITIAGSDAWKCKVALMGACLSASSTLKR